MKAYSYVRWSSAKQTQGDSLRRQTELARQYARRHHLQLDETSRVDAGLSAYTGKNIVEGELGSFLKAIDEGKIETPCYLLVEALDRITRAQINRALRLFLDIIDRGVTIVTLQNEQRFSSETTNSDNGIGLIIAITMLVAGHEDSKKRGQRVKASWDNKRKAQLSGVIASSKGPSWLKLSPDKSRWVIDQKRATVVQQIFSLALDGWGSMRIAGHLNKNKVPCLARAEFWTHGNVGALLQQEAVFGRFKQTHGDHVVDNYYPPIVSEEIFHAVQASRMARRGKGGAHQEATNLFAGMCYCAYCGAHTRYSVSGTKSNRTPYLRCLTATNKGGCEAASLPYELFEKAFIRHLGAFADLYDPGDGQTAHSLNIRQLEAKIKAANEELEKLVEMALLAPTVRRLALLMEKKQTEIDSLSAELKRSQMGTITPNQTMEMVDLLKSISENGGDQTIRGKARAAIRMHYSRIEIAPRMDEMIGFDPKVKSVLGLNKRGGWKRGWGEDPQHGVIFQLPSGHRWAMELRTNHQPLELDN